MAATHAELDMMDAFIVLQHGRVEGLSAELHYHTAEIGIAANEHRLGFYNSFSDQDISFLIEEAFW